MLVGGGLEGLKRYERLKIEWALPIQAHLAHGMSALRATVARARGGGFVISALLCGLIGGDTFTSLVPKVPSRLSLRALAGDRVQNDVAHI